MSEKKVIKLGVVGCGRGFSVAAQVAGDPDVKITALCDINPDAMNYAYDY